MTRTPPLPDTPRPRRLPVGAEPIGEGEVHFRVWAADHPHVDLVLEDGPGAPASIRMERGHDGYHTAVATASAGTLYRFRLSDDRLYPDPVSRFQPQGPEGPSQVVDPGSYRWSDADWTGVTLPGQIIYELHIGTFTPERSWRAAAEQLPELAALGVTALEIMPVAEFPGAFGWGYDGVDLFAPYHGYGTPDDFRRFVDRAHQQGLAVIHDVVYNHLGPSGNYLARFSESYFTDQYETEWGDPLNFHGRGSDPVREFFIANAAYWMDEFHLDGLRLDATQSIHDVNTGARHILAEITRAAREAAGGRTIIIIAENEPQDASLVRPASAGGFGMDGLWNDDFHHAAAVALTGRKEAYYRDYLGAPQEFVSSARWGFLYQGQHYSWHESRRGSPALDVAPHAFVNYLQNHDQVANSGRGERIHRLTSPARLRAMTGLLLLGPATPLLFMGQEFGASAPFLYFADHEKELAEAVRDGRRQFLAQFPSLEGANLPSPDDPATWRRCVLDFGERERHAETYLLHRELIRIRRTDPVLSRARTRGPEGAVLGAQAFVLRYFDESAEEGDRLLLVNLGRELTFTPAPEPLLAPPDEGGWQPIWCSESPRYGGGGAPSPEGPRGQWHIPAECTMLLVPARSARGPA